ncbi:putative aquaporin 2 [Lyophyllum atratum]|nr:putative aquaporin 2 [Lyophyllum atratum]
MAQPIVYRSDFEPRSKIFKAWEKQRNKREVHWFMECFAEALGVFFYVYAGVGSQTAWVTGNILVGAKLAPVGLSSIFQVGFAYMGGILLALGVCGGTSGGHFNPCVSIAFTVFKGFPPLKALRYIIAQILGAYIACLLIYTQYKVTFEECTAILNAAKEFDALNFTPNGLAGIFGFYLLPGQRLGLTFLNEFVSDTFIGLAIWASLDSSNALIPPVMGPILVSMAYGTAIWGFSMPGLVANSARDLGGRLMAMTIWGSQAAGGPYSAIAALTNIPATLFAAFIYEFFLTDSDRVVSRAAHEFGIAHASHRRHAKERLHNVQQLDDSERQTPMDDDKPTTFTYEHSERAPR